MSLCDTEEEEGREARKKIEGEQPLLPVESVSRSRLQKSHVRRKTREKLIHGWNFRSDDVSFLTVSQHFPPARISGRSPGRRTHFETACKSDRRLEVLQRSPVHHSIKLRLPLPTDRSPLRAANRGPLDTVLPCRQKSAEERTSVHQVIFHCSPRYNVGRIQLAVCGSFRVAESCICFRNS